MSAESEWVYGDDVGLPGRGWITREEAGLAASVAAPVTEKLRAIPTSQNGYVANNRSQIVTLTAPGTDVQFPVRKGPCGELLMWAAGRWHREVEPLVKGTCWGYAERAIIGGTQLSNHASGTAIDVNAPQHPLATNPAANFSAAQLAAVRRIVADAKGALRWGGDYTGRRDGMHLEINAPEARVAEVLAAVTGSQNPGSAVTEDESAMIEDVWHQLNDAWPAWGGGITDDKNTPYRLAQYVLRSNVEIHQTALMVQQLLKAQQAKPAPMLPAEVGRIAATVVAHQKASTERDITHRTVDESTGSMETPRFWLESAERALKSVAQFLITLWAMTGPMNLFSVDWKTAAGLALGSGLLSILTSIVSAGIGPANSPSLVRGHDQSS